VIIEGRAVLIPEDNVDTDVLYPGALLNLDDPEKMKPYLFEGYDPSLRDEVAAGDAVIVVGENFGIGSSREHVPLAMLAWGVRCVLGKSFARIFYRNCVNLGLLAVACREAVADASRGSSVRVDTDSGRVEVDGRPFQAEPLHPFVREVMGAGGLVAWARAELEEAR
jgi:3-isopropylmalate/(R)-2-methylmalate dehydratase small subunit